jgi:hypothetical protein
MSSGRVALATFGLAILTLGMAFAASASDISGNWVIKWDSGPPNALSLTTNADGDLSGTYTNDAKQTCSVTGHYGAATRDFAVHIKCSNYNVELEGSLSADGATAPGKYWFKGTMTGTFTMARPG